MCINHYFTEELIKEYSKKIFGFALSKTKNLDQAEELSQEILLNLTLALKKEPEIHSIEHYIYTLCYYTWSKYVRKHIKSWRNESLDQYEKLADSQDIEADYILQEDLKNLRQEVAYLMKMQRQITIAFYYENKSSQKIAKDMGIKDSTVRWHLTEIRRKLKEGIEMNNERLSYQPNKLTIWHTGSAGEVYNILKKDLLCQNIVIACYGDPLTIEEIGRKLQVASAYLEVHIERLVFLDYLKVVGKNKYQTNFWIKTQAEAEQQAKTQYELMESLAKPIYQEIQQKLQAIREIGFIGCDLEDSELLWLIIGYYTVETFWESGKKYLEKYKVQMPERKDGTRHWIGGTVITDEQMPTTYCEKVGGSGVKDRSTLLGVRSFQMDAPICVGWREFDVQELNALYRIRELIIQKIKPNANDQLMISEMVEAGYVEVKDFKIQIKVPFLTEKEMESLDQIIDEIYKLLGSEMYETFLQQMSPHISSLIPSFIAKEEKYYHMYSVYPVFGVLNWLIDHEYLERPTQQMAKRMGTLVWLEDN